MLVLTGTHFCKTSVPVPHSWHGPGNHGSHIPQFRKMFTQSANKQDKAQLSVVKHTFPMLFVKLPSISISFDVILLQKKDTQLKHNMLLRMAQR